MFSPNSATLQGRGLNLAAAIGQQRFIGLEVADILSIFMVHDLPEPARFYRAIGDLIVSQTAAGGAFVPRHLRRIGVNFVTKGNADGAIQVEQLCNQLTEPYGMNVLCGFSWSSFYREEDKETFQTLCANTKT